MRFALVGPTLEENLSPDGRRPQAQWNVGEARGPQTVTIVCRRAAEGAGTLRRVVRSFRALWHLPDDAEPSVATCAVQSIPFDLQVGAWRRT